MANRFCDVLSSTRRLALFSTFFGSTSGLHPGVITPRTKLNVQRYHQLSTTAAVWWLPNALCVEHWHSLRFPAAKKLSLAHMGGYCLKPDAVQHPIRRPSSSSHRHSSASCEGWAPSTRGSRRGAERPRASLHSAKNRRAERSGHPTESTEWRIGRRPTPSSRRGTACDAGRFRASKQPETTRHRTSTSRKPGRLVAVLFQQVD